MRNVAAKENTPAYKVEYQDADSMKSVFKKELHKKYANVEFKKKTKNVVLYIGKKDSDQKNYYVQLKGSHMVYLSDKDVVKNILNP